MNERVIFPDAMVFLQYQPVEQIPWTDLFACERVVLALAQSVVTELDRHKDHGTKRLRDRARRALNVIQRGTEGQNPRPGVAIHFCANAPDIDLRSHGLDRERNDDQLIAAVLDYTARNPQADVALVTHDVTPALKAKQLGLAVHQLPDKYALPADPDPLEVELRAAQAELARYQSARARVDLSFADGEKHMRVALPPWENLSEEWIEARLEEVREEYPAYRSQQKLQGGTADLGALASLAPLTAYGPNEIERYNRALDEFYAEYEVFLRRHHLSVLAHARSFELALHLVNEGTLPADDVDVLLHLPDGFLVAEEIPDGPSPPEPPRGPITATQRIAESMRFPGVHVPRLDFDLPSDLAPRNVSPPTIRETSSYDVEMTVHSLKHGFRQPLDSFWVIFGEADDLRSFSIDYKPVAGNIPGSVEGQLHVVVEPEE